LAPLSGSGTFRNCVLDTPSGERDEDLFYGWTLDVWTSGKHLVLSGILILMRAFSATLFYPSLTPR
jgi:hypothetical protein